LPNFSFVKEKFDKAMGQKRVTLVDLSEKEQQKKVSQKRAAKTTGKTVSTGKRAGRIADKAESIEDIKLEAEKPEEKEEKVEKKQVTERRPRVRGRRYKLARSQVDRTKSYPIDQAIDLIKRTSIARFNGTISAHLNLNQEKFTTEVNFPHPTGKQVRVAIASDAVFKKIEAKKIDFDVLLATPDMMKKLTKVAKILGPMGLMPNPKNGTLTDNPKKRKKELESGKTQVKTESKAPLMHIVIGKANQDTKKLSGNLQALIEAVDTKRIKKLTLASTMSPGVKVELSDLQK
jgi:large subunit ribosomal protein L1